MGKPFCTYQVRYRYMDSDPEYQMCGEAAVQETSEGPRCEQHRIKTRKIKQCLRTTPAA